MGVIATLFTITTLISSFIIYKITVDVTTLKMARKPVNIQRKVQQDALGKVSVNHITDDLEVKINSIESRKSVAKHCNR